MFVVRDNPYNYDVPGIMGMNILKNCNFLGLLNMTTSNTKSHVNCNKIQTGSNGHIGFVKLSAKKMVNVPKRSEMIVTGYCQAGKFEHVYTGIVEPTQNNHLPTNVLVGRVCANVKHGLVPVRLINLSDPVVCLKPRAKLAHLHIVETVECPNVNVQINGENVDVELQPECKPRQCSDSIGVNVNRPDLSECQERN